MTELRIERLTITGAPLGEENPLPYFRDPQVDRDVAMDESVPPEKRAHLGKATGFRVLPYRMQDQYTRQKQPLQFRAIVLENEFLTATFLPELGGRLISLVYRPYRRELLHRNPVFQPANLAIRNAWFSGGIEWNLGQYGHAFTTCSPLFASVIEGPQGEPGLRLYEFERCKRLFWQIDFYLPQNFPFLLAYARVANPYPEDTWLYWWTNVAVNEAPDVRVLAAADRALYLKAHEKQHAFGLTDLPGLPSLHGTDGTYALNSPFANEFFFQCEESGMPWEAALDYEGKGFVEASTPRLAYRKLFCWGNQPGGRHWQTFLAEPGQAYLEIQAGLAPTQLHGLPMQGNSILDWTQVFGYLEVEARRVHGSDWRAARMAVEEALVKAKITPSYLSGWERTCRNQAGNPFLEILQTGSGWGRLELERRRHQNLPDPTPASLVFPRSTLGPEQDKWLYLLEKGSLPEQDPSEMPGEWLVQPEWQAVLEDSLKDEEKRNWFALLHLGVMRLEQFDEAGAAEAWLESIQKKPSPWACRNLAVLRLRQHQVEEACDWYEKAWRLAEESGFKAPALVSEALRCLVEAGHFAKARAYYDRLPREIQAVDRVQMLMAQVALKLGDLEQAEELLLREYAIVREGEIVLTDLWFELKARQMAISVGEPFGPAFLEKARRQYPPPSQIDFRVSGEE